MYIGTAVFVLGTSQILWKEVSVGPVLQKVRSAIFAVRKVQAIDAEHRKYREISRVSFSTFLKCTRERLSAKRNKFFVHECPVLFSAIRAVVFVRVYDLVTPLTSGLRGKSSNEPSSCVLSRHDPLQTAI